MKWALPNLYLNSTTSLVYKKPNRTITLKESQFIPQLSLIFSKCYHKVNLPIQNFKETDNGIFGFQNKSTTAVANTIPEYYYHYYEGFHQELLKTTKSLYYSLLLPDITAPKWNFICD